MIKIIITTDINGFLVPLENPIKEMEGNIVAFDPTLYSLLIEYEDFKCRNIVLYSDDVLVPTPRFIYSTNLDKLLRDYYRYCSEVDFIVLGGKRLFDDILERNETCEITLTILNRSVESEEQLDINSIINNEKNKTSTMDVLEDGTEVYTISRKKQE